MTRKTSKKRDPNISPVGWYIGSIILRFEELSGTDRRKNRKRHLVWENTLLIKARKLKQAYDKLISQGKLQTSPYVNTDGIRVRFRFEGIGFLLPIYDSLEDLSEVIWTEHANISDARIRKLVKTKRELLAPRKTG